MDKRVIKTKTSIKSAFMSLMIERDPQNITVSDIADHAKINRSTFYLHYRDISDIVRDIDKEFADKIAMYLQKIDISDTYASTYNLFSYLTSMLEKESLIKQYIIFSSDTTNIAEKLKDILIEKTIEAIKEFSPNKDIDGIKYSITFAAAGIIDCYVRWVKAGNDKPTEKLIHEISSITEHIINNIMI